MEEKFSFQAADEIIDLNGPGFEQTGAKLRHHCLKMVFLENAWCEYVKESC